MTLALALVTLHGLLGKKQVCFDPQQFTHSQLIEMIRACLANLNLPFTKAVVRNPQSFVELQNRPVG